MDLRKLPLNNLKRNPGRTAGLMVLVALLAFILFGGSMVMSSLRTGLDSLEARLGADVLVVPKSARISHDLQDILVNGVPGEFYMDAAFVDKVAARDGVEAVSPQYYLATLKASCCSMPVQIIGFDPETDFTIAPWIARSYSDTLGPLDVVVGCNVGGQVGTQITFFNTDCTIVGKMDETGTALDNAVYASAETLATLIEAAVDQGVSKLEGYDPTAIVSTIQVKVADGYSIDNVVDDINLHMRGTWAVQSSTVTSGVADSMAGVSSVIGAMVGVMWVLVAAMLVVAFLVLGRHRAKEFAVLRVVGASRKALSRVVLGEALIVSAAGAVAGIVVAFVLVVAFNGMLEGALGLPFLMPGAGQTALFALLAFAVTMVAGPASSVVSARQLSKVDPGQTLREA